MFNSVFSCDVPETEGKTVRDVLGPETSLGNPLKQACFQGMAAYLNAFYFGSEKFGLSHDEVKLGFRSAHENNTLGAYKEYIAPFNVHDTGDGRTCPIGNDYY